MDQLLRSRPEVLLDFQIKRPRQISRKKRGVQILRDPEFRKELNLSRHQSKKLDDLFAEHRSRSHETFKELQKQPELSGVRAMQQKLPSKTDERKKLLRQKTEA